MARNTFQGRLRTTNGRPRSAISEDTGLPVTVLAQNVMGPIQVIAPEGMAAGEKKVVGMLPAYTVVLQYIDMASGNVSIALPAYGGMAAVNNAAISAAAGTAATAVGPFGKDRPVEITVTAATTAPERVCLMAFALDDASSELV